MIFLTLNLAYGSFSTAMVKYETRRNEYIQYTIYTSWSGILMIFLTLNLAYGSFSTAMVKYETRR
ncbi:hypothetical protein DW070_17330, partial [Coprococcus catus]